MTGQSIVAELEERVKKTEKDLHARIQSDETLNQSERQYRDVLSGIEDGYYEVDIAGNLTFFNDSLCKIYGYTRDELMGMNNREYMSPETVKKTYEIFNRVYKTGESTKIFDWEFINKDGTKIDVEISVSLIKISEEEAIGFRGIVRDIGERKRIEAELQKAHNELERRVEERAGDLIKINKRLEQEITERKQVEAALRESENKFRTFVEKTP
ncbi:MAG: PAS domain S-box protein, partial [Desulfatirhabdiaceae bacterium]|nr:PAS domain S-box protein [Desulfatirhabdiaceae bacterium]